MNKAEKFVRRIFWEETRMAILHGDAWNETVKIVYDKFKGKKLPPEYENALIKVKKELF